MKVSERVQVAQTKDRLLALAQTLRDCGRIAQAKRLGGITDLLNFLSTYPNARRQKCTKSK